MPEEIPYHIPTAFKVGDKVVVARAVMLANAWHTWWSESAQRLVGKEVRVASVDAIQGFWCAGRGVGKEVVRAWLPSCALERSRPAEGVIIVVPSEET